ncbi:MAG: VWA domain-containing protein [Tissierellia bacterium]|nr:VWA domain-containing protein [Tissierellia bacterium]
MIRQIILVSDGKSNRGPDPSEMAELALDRSIRVSTIGIIDNYDQSAVLELESIAERGGGVCELTSIENLSETLSRVTVRSIYQTIEQVVNNQLKSIMDKEIDEIRPEVRQRIINMMDKIGDETPLKCLILLDTSGSMRDKIEISKKSIYELLLFLEERSGENQIGVIRYPSLKADYELLCEFTDDLSKLREKISHIEVGGITPTGSAIEGAIKVFEGADEEYLVKEYVI